jgi:hypothetical protein
MGEERPACLGFSHITSLTRHYVGALSTSETKHVGAFLQNSFQVVI